MWAFSFRDYIRPKKGSRGNTREKLAISGSIFKFFLHLQCFLIGDISDMGEKRNTDSKHVQRQALSLKQRNRVKTNSIRSHESKGLHHLEMSQKYMAAI